MGSNASVQTGFDYTQLAPDVRQDAEAATRRLHDLERRTSESVVEIGQILIQQRNRTEGHFLDWLKQGVGWSKSTAYNFIAVAEKFADVPNFGSIAPSALYTLAAESTPEEVRIEFTELAKTGRAVRHKDVKEAVANTKARTKAEPIPVQEWESGDDDYPEVPYEVVDMSSGEIMPPPGQRNSMTFPAMPSPVDGDDEEDGEHTFSGIAEIEITHEGEYFARFTFQMEDIERVTEGIEALIRGELIPAKAAA